jgi:uncharacterized membrane protein
MVKKRRELMFGGLVVLLLLATTLAIVTYSTPQTAGVLGLLVSHHVTLMLVLVFVSIAFGYMWATMLKRELQREQAGARHIGELVTRLLSREERIVLQMLLANGGTLKQAELARREGMTRVKAHRTVKLLAERGVVRVERHGKIANVYLDEALYERLSQTS